MPGRHFQSHFRLKLVSEIYPIVSVLSLLLTRNVPHMSIISGTNHRSYRTLNTPSYISRSHSAFRLLVAIISRLNSCHAHFDGSFFIDLVYLLGLVPDSVIDGIQQHHLHKGTTRAPGVAPLDLALRRGSKRRDGAVVLSLSL